MPYIGSTPALNYISYAVQNFTVTAGTTVYTLDYSVANENDIRLVINNVIQRPGASYAYSATGTTLTLTSATLSTDTMYAVFIGRAVQTVTPPANINLQLADGTASAPSLNFANDTNTGIFRPTTDTIALTEGGVEGMRLNASGNVQFSGNIGLGGTTPTTSGTGITFPATQSASTDANTLDDYEEGTYTIATNTNLTASSGYATFQYTKIGRQVTVNGGLVVSAVSSTNDVTISLPFTSKGNPASGQSVGAGAVCPLGGVTTGDAGLVSYIGTSATNMLFYKINNNGATVRLTNADLAVNDELLITATYFV